MISKNKIIIPAFVLGALLIGGTPALAFFQGTVPASALEGFSQAEQTAIQKAFEIRRTNHEEAQTLLDDASVDREKLRKAVREYRASHRTAIKTAIENNDYATFKNLVAKTPLANTLTEDTFAKIFEAHALRESGDREGAREIMKELGIGFGKGGFHGSKRI